MFYWSYLSIEVKEAVDRGVWGEGRWFDHHCPHLIPVQVQPHLVGGVHGYPHLCATLVLLKLLQQKVLRILRRRGVVILSHPVSIDLEATIATERTVRCDHQLKLLLRLLLWVLEGVITNSNYFYGYLSSFRRKKMSKRQCFSARFISECSGNPWSQKTRILSFSDDRNWVKITYLRTTAGLLLSPTAVMGRWTLSGENPIKPMEKEEVQRSFSLFTFTWNTSFVLKGRLDTTIPGNKYT